jgi:metallo-beta-lactamase class B
MGRDPQTVKYVIATHGHSDHFGGMQELKKLIPGARMAMSAPDWEYAVLRPDARADRGKPPARDMIITEGQKLTLGDTTITIYVTPGHTPGSLAFIVPVKVGGVPHTISIWGGTSPTNNAYSLAEYRLSLDRFRPMEKTAEAEGRLSTHPYWTNMLPKLQKLRANPTGPNPFLETRADMTRYESVFDECLKAEAAAIP